VTKTTSAQDAAAAAIAAQEALNASTAEQRRNKAQLDNDPNNRALRNRYAIGQGNNSALVRGFAQLERRAAQLAFNERERQEAEFTPFNADAAALLAGPQEDVTDRQRAAAEHVRAEMRDILNQRVAAKTRIAQADTLAESLSSRYLDHAR
jgi:hypothetical protein